MDLCITTRFILLIRVGGAAAAVGSSKKVIDILDLSFSSPRSRALNYSLFGFQFQ